MNERDHCPRPKVLRMRILYRHGPGDTFRTAGVVEVEEDPEQRHYLRALELALDRVWARRDGTYIVQEQGTNFSRIFVVRTKPTITEI